MGRQVNFYLFGDDHALLQRLIESAGPVAFVQDRQASPDLVPVTDLRITPELMGKVPLRIYATQPAAVQHLSLRWIPQQNYHIIEIGSAAIEVDRCFFDGTVARSGRIYAHTSPWRQQDTDEWDGFQTWSRRVMRRVVDGFKREGNRLGARPFFTYFGPEAYAWMKRVGAPFSSNELHAP